MQPVRIDGSSLTLDQLEAIARTSVPVELPESAWTRIRLARAVVERATARDDQVYGLSTGVGALARHGIPSAERAAFQEQMIRTHAVGVGPALPTEQVRAIIAARLNGIAVGLSSAGPDLAKALLALLNHRIHPIVPALGSLGASDLAQNAAIANVLLGFGEAEYNGRKMAGGAALDAAGLQPLSLGHGEALALISANSLTLGAGSLALAESRRLARVFDYASALSFEGFAGNLSILHPAAVNARPQGGHADAAARLRDLLEGSSLWEEHAARFLQDPLSFRCVAHVHGVLLHTLEGLVKTTEASLNASGDNPLVLVDEDRVFSTANFDVTLLAVGFDTLRLAWLQAGSIADRRIDKLVTPSFSGLPAGLAHAGGANDGLTIVSYTASSLAAELRALAQPVSLGVAPSAEGVEDHASLAPLSVRRVKDMHSVLARLAALELIVGAEAVDRRGVSRLGRGAAAAFALVRSYAPSYGPDWHLAAEPLADRLLGHGIEE